MSFARLVPFLVHPLCYPIVTVIAETRRIYNLDPIQINNHIENSLFQTEEKNEPIYFKYAEIAEILKKTQTYMGFQFVEYLTILGHLKITSLPLACSAHADIRNKVRFTPCHTVMQDIFSKGVDKRNPTAIRKHLNKDSYLREINLCFEKEDYIYISLAMGPTMNSAKAMYREFNTPLQFSDKHIQKPWSNFHLQYQRGRNIGQSYRNDQPEWPVEEYIAYWRNHADQLKMMSSAEAADYIEKNCDDLHLSAQKAGELVSLLRNRKNPVNIVPELIYEIRWSCEEIANMKDNAEFEASLKAALKEFLDAINYEVSGINC